jgi:FkbM family methyltransferase
MLPDLLRRNLPSQKPQIWEHPLLSAERRLRRVFGRFLDHDWDRGRHLVRLAEGDLRMEVSPALFIENAVFLFGQFEAETTRFFQAYLKTGMCVLDVGANIGYCTLVAASRVGSSGMVHAFEPVEGLRSRLGQHVQLNQLEQRVTIHSEAVSRASGPIQFFESGWGLNHGLGTTVATANPGSVTRTIPAVTVDEFVRRKSVARVDLIKIDVEGAEADVLVGAAELLARPDAPAILVEANRPDLVVPLLQGCGYEVRGLRYSIYQGLQFPSLEGGVVAHAIGVEAPNLVAIKRPRAPADFDRLAAVSRQFVARHSVTARLLQRLEPLSGPGSF